jgi:N4-gp56 family major capsid protein
MATFDSANGVTKAAAKTAGFVPEIWADEIFAAYKKALVVAALVQKLPVKGQKGDVVHVPKPSRGNASQKASLAQVVLDAESGTEVQVALDQHWHRAKMIEDIAEKQGKATLRQFYTKDFGYSLQRAVDEFLLQQFRKVNGGNGTIAYDKAVIGSDGSTLYIGSNEAAITDVGLRRVIQTLDDNDVPMDERYFVIPPVAKNTLMGLARFTEQAFTGQAGANSPILNGRLGNIYGVETFVTSLCETATGAARIAPLFHKEAIVLCEQMSPRVQTQQKLEFLGDLMVADVIFGANELRNEAAIAIAVTA